MLSFITGVVAPVGLTPAFGATKPAATSAVTIMYRQYNPSSFANNHNYTTSSSEKNYLIFLGWKYEGIGWYGQ